LGCGGTIAKHTKLGHKVGIVDFNRGELGTRGTPAIRDQEAKESAAILGVSVRENLNLGDGFFQNDPDTQRAVIRAIRKYQPRIILANALHDRHVDHPKGASLAYDASFLSGLVKIETSGDDGKKQNPWRPSALYHYVQSHYIEPDFVVDISAEWEIKMTAVRAFRSQFFNIESREPETYISKPGFLKMLEARAIEYGHGIDVTYGEGFTTRRFLGVDDLFHLK
jgi:N-acetylglucosamine malate deacetylase 1